MLIDFKIENNLSFKESTTFTMQTGARLVKFNDTHILKNDNVNLLKNAMIFGANGSGKTNLFTSLDQFKRLLLTLGDAKQTSKNIVTNPFRMQYENKNKPTKFDITLLLKKKIYNYCIEFNEEQIILEKLLEIKKNKESILFERIYQHEDEYKYEINSNRIDKKLQNFTRKNNLFLSVLASFNNKIALEIMDWFQNKLVLIRDDSMEFERDPLAAKLLDTKFKEEVLNILKIADFNIEDIKVTKRIVKADPQFFKLMEEVSKQIGGSLLTEVIIHEITLIYNNYDNEGRVVGSSEIGLLEDSKGTIKMLYIAAIIVDSFNEGRTILLDEFDTAFHLAICEFLIALFNSKRNMNNQFILITHELELLDCELRVDQIWFAQKNYKNETELYSLFDFNDLNNRKRSDVSYAKKYIKGQFGAKPVIDLLSAKNYFLNTDLNLNLFEGSELNE
ncbi:AAA family ATPase [Psychrobacillus vulpis]|nr:ATP-binding protein [Psychrobacillus vulpis]